MQVRHRRGQLRRQSGSPSTAPPGISQRLQGHSPGGPNAMMPRAKDDHPLRNLHSAQHRGRQPARIDPARVRRQGSRPRLRWFGRRSRKNSSSRWAIYSAALDKTRRRPLPDDPTMLRGRSFFGHGRCFQIPRSPKTWTCPLPAISAPLATLDRRFHMLERSAAWWRPAARRRAAGRLSGKLVARVPWRPDDARRPRTAARAHATCLARLARRAGRRSRHRAARVRGQSPAGLPRAARLPYRGLPVRRPKSARSAGRPWRRGLPRRTASASETDCPRNPQHARRCPPLLRLTKLP